MNKINIEMMVPNNKNLNKNDDKLLRFVLEWIMQGLPAV